MRISTVLSQLAFGTLEGQPGEAKTAPTTSPDHSSHFGFCYCFRDRNNLAQAGPELSLCTENWPRIRPLPHKSSSFLLPSADITGVCHLVPLGSHFEKQVSRNISFAPSTDYMRSRSCVQKKKKGRGGIKESTKIILHQV